MLLVTGGSGFIGSNFIFEWINRKGLSGNSVLINLDKLTYASNLKTLDIFKNNKKYIFVQGDIADYSLVLFLLKKYKIQFIFNFAAESHVDRSISNPIIFVKNNVTQTSHLLEAVRSYWLSLSKEKKRIFRFVHISTDEVYGTLKYKSSSSFSEDDPYNPTNPYSASKAASNHLIKAYYYTYRLPILITNSSNNYGPYQHPEKLIPLIITSAISNKELPIYGHGEHIRDWLYVKDHCSALIYILKHGNIGEIYNINGKNEKKNLEVVHKICSFLDKLKPKKRGFYSDQIQFVQNRLGHDYRYAINSNKLKKLGWRSVQNFDDGLQKTVKWYLENSEWMNGFNNPE